MKKIICIALFVSIAFLVHAQQGHVNTYGFAGYNEGIKVAHHTNGFLIAGNSTEPSGNNRFYMIKTDSSGDPLLDYHYFRFSLTRINDMSVISPDSILIAGTILNDSNSYDFFISMLDTSGNIYWRKQFGGASWQEINTITSDQQGFWVGGYTYSDSALSDQGYLAYLGMDGTIQKSQTANDSTDNTINAIEMIGDSLLVTAGSRFDLQHSVKTGHLVIRTDSFQTILDTVFADSVKNDLLFCQWHDPFLITGGYQLRPQKKRQGWNISMKPFDSYGKSFLFGKSGNETFYDAAVTPQNHVYLTGHTESFGAGLKDILYTKRNQKGYWLASSNMGDVKNETGYSILSTDSTGFAITGNTRSWGPAHSNIFLLTADSITQNITCQYHFTNINTEHKTNFNVHPNPFSGKVKLETPNRQRNENRQLIIRDLSGKTVYKTSSPIPSTLDLKKLKTGFYIFTLYTHRETFSQKIIKQR